MVLPLIFRILELGTKLELRVFNSYIGVIKGEFYFQTLECLTIKIRVIIGGFQPTEP